MQMGEFKWTESHQYFLLSGFYIGFAILQPIGGRLCDKYGGKKFFIFGMIGQSIAFMGIPVFSKFGYQGALIMRIIQGLIAVNIFSLLFNRFYFSIRKI